MEYQTLINTALGATLAVAGWFARQLWDSVKQLRMDHEAHRVEVAKDYLSKETFRYEFDGWKSEVRNSFQRIFDVLDNKVNR